MEASGKHMILYEENIKWLCNNDSPQEEAIEKWNSTILNREPPGKQIKAYFSKYKCLRANYGHVLVIVLLYE